MQIIDVYGNLLDNWTHNEPNKNLSYGWTQVCDKHVAGFPENMIDYGSGHGICGVAGCNSEANHYVDFNWSDFSQKHTVRVLIESDEEDDLTVDLLMLSSDDVIDLRLELAGSLAYIREYEDTHGRVWMSNQIRRTVSQEEIREELYSQNSSR